MAEHKDVALIRRGYEAFSTGDGATLTEIIAADATQYQPGSGELAGEHHGQGRVVATHHATGHRQGRQLDTRASLIFTVSDGMARDIHGCQEDIDAWDTFWA